MNFLTGALDNIYERKSFFKDKLILNLLGVGIILNILIWIFVLIKFGAGMEAVVLHYNVEFGADLVDTWSKIFTIPVSALVFVIVNTLLAYLFYKLESFLSYIILIASFVLQVFFLITIITLWVMNKS